MSGLARVGQDDFGAGMLRGVAPDVQPGVGLFNAINAFINDDGDIYRRGGTVEFSDDAPLPLTFIWTGYINNQPRALIATKDHFYTLDGFTAGSHLVQLGGAAGGLIAPVLPAIVANQVFLPNALKWDGTGVMAGWTIPASLPAGERHVCAAAGRLLVATGNRVAFSVANEPQNFVADDFHDLPGGVLVMGMTAIRDTAFVFTNYGLYTISNLAFDLTDALGNTQQTLQLITPELSLVHESGLTAWAGVIVAPCSDRVFLIDGLSQPVPISDSIGDVYQAYIQDGYRPGGATVFRNHYFLPILDAAGTTPITLLACRLDRPVKGRQVYYPWTTVTGQPAEVVMGDFALVGSSPSYLGASTDGCVFDLTGLLNPSELVASDADAQTYPFDVETRDFPTGQGQPNHVRALRLRYTIEGDALMAAAVSVGRKSQLYEDLLPATYADVFATYATYDEMWRGGPTSGMPVSDGDPDRYWYRVGQTLLEESTEPVTWRLQTARRTRYVRARIRVEDPVARLIIHHLDLSVRQATHDR